MTRKKGSAALLTSTERLLVRAESGVAERTLKRWEDGDVIQDVSRRRIEAALAKVRKREQDE